MSTPRTTYQLIEDGRIAERARDHQRSLDRAYTKALNERLASNVDGTPGPAPQKECYPAIPSAPAKVQAQTTGGSAQPARGKPRISEPVTPGPDFGGKAYLQFALFSATVAGLAGSAYAATFLQPLS